MNPKYKKPLIIIIVILAIIVIAVLIMNSVAETKIENLLKKSNAETEIETKDISVNVLTGSVTVEKPAIKVQGKTTGETNLQAEFETFEMEGFNVFNYLMSEDISIDKLLISNGTITLRKNPSSKNKNYKAMISEKIKNKLEIDEIEMNSVDVTIMDESFTDNISKINTINFSLKDLEINPKAEEVMTYDDLRFSTKAIEHRINEYENLFIESVFVNDNKAELKVMEVKTRLSKAELSNAISIERDHFDLNLNTVMFNGIDYGFNASDKLYFTAVEVVLNTPNASIYRDKLVADDTVIKPMYSQMLRDLDFDLNIDNVKINKATLVYSEKLNTDTKAGNIDFKDLNMTIANFGNIDSTKTVNITLNSKFMGNTNLNVNWSFNVWNSADYFRFKGKLNRMEAAQINQFTTPNMNIKLEGIIDSNDFTIAGNRENAQIDMRLKYDDFKVLILKDNGKDKKTLLSGLVNLFIKSDSKADDNGFRYGHANEVARDKTKSIFNFVWLNLRAGLFSTFAGDGEREKN